jgi:hypothetical protein
MYRSITSRISRWRRVRAAGGGELGMASVMESQGTGVRGPSQTSVREQSFVSALTANGRSWQAVERLFGQLVDVLRLTFAGQDEPASCRAAQAPTN